MNDAERLRKLFCNDDVQPGVVGFVSRLLTECHDHYWELDWRQPDQCTFLGIDTGTEVTIEVPFRPSVFRATIARVAALSDEIAATFRIAFSNDPNDLWLTIKPRHDAPAQIDGSDALAAQAHS